MAELKLAPDVEEIGMELVSEFHDHLRTNGTRILYVHSDQDKASHGKPVLAEVRALGGATFALGILAGGGDPADIDYDFAITVYGSIWEGLSPKGRKAAVDEQLCRLVQKTVRRRDGEETTIVIRDWDVKAFSANLLRFGFWLKEHRTFQGKVRQLPLDLAREEEEAEPGALVSEGHEALLGGVR